MTFAAIDPYIHKNIIEPTERIAAGRDYVDWGDRNGYPDYLVSLYRTVASLRSVVNGSVDYTCGNGVDVAFYPQNRAMNRRGQTADEFVHELALSFFLYGGFAIEVIRDRGGDIAELYPVELRYLRSSKDNAVFWYSEEWGKGSSGTRTVVRPKFLPEARGVAASVLYVKNTSMQTYPEPLYGASVKACEVERSADDYHLNSIKNGFAGGVVVTFPGPAPEEQQQEEIEKNFDQKFCGSENASRSMLIWGDGGTQAPTVRQIDIKDYGDKYAALVKHCRQQIFTAFRANPNLFGIPTDNLGFSSEEYEAAFKLYNRTQIQPAQRLICSAVGKILGGPDYMTIHPFTLE